MEITVLVFPVRGRFIDLALKKTGAAAGCLSGWRDHFDPREDMFLELTACRVMKEQGGIKVLPKDLIDVAILNFIFKGEHKSRCHVYFIEREFGQVQETRAMGRPTAYAFDEVPYDKMLPTDRECLRRVLAGERLICAVHCNDELGTEPRFEVLEPYPQGPH
jgi:hypothetical protein